MLSLILLLLSLTSHHQGVTAKVSHKKGMCIPPGKNFHCGDFSVFSHASWWYNWYTEPNHVMDGWCTCQDPAGCEEEPDSPAFIPMIMGYHEDNPWHSDESNIVKDKYDTILVFNEPNREEHSDLSPEVAAVGWMEIQAMYPDKTLVSPAPAGNPTKWFDEFFAECEILGCRIDYLATHDYRGNANQVMNRLEMLYNRYCKKIWLTEFAKCCTNNQDEVVKFVEEIIPRLEEADYVWRYSWFITRYNPKNECPGDGGWCLDSVNSLLEDQDQPKLSRVGEAYNRIV